MENQQTPAPAAEAPPAPPQTVKKEYRKENKRSEYFPSLPIQLSTKEKVRLIIKQHNHGYFVGQTLEELDNIEPLIRPLKEITNQFKSDQFFLSRILLEEQTAAKLQAMSGEIERIATMNDNILLYYISN